MFARKPRKNQCFAPNILSSLYPPRNWQLDRFFTAAGAEERGARGKQIYKEARKPGSQEARKHK